MDEIKIYKVIADKKPMFCMECPLNNSCVKIDMECGEIKTVLDEGSGWKTGGKMPDNRCLIMTVEEMEDAYGNNTDIV